MKINILRLIEGAKKAEGLTVIIDVFRAFSLECYLFDMGAKRIRPAGSIAEAFALGDLFEDSVLIGEREGKKCAGFDFGNSPSSIDPKAVKGKTIIHTTSAGTQGIVCAVNASEVITGSLVNAAAVADYILSQNPETVSLVCMGNGGIRPAKEDELCALYIKSLLEKRPLGDIDKQIADLQFSGGEHFFAPIKQEIFPEKDFWMCIDYNRFPFVIKIKRDEFGLAAFRIDAGFGCADSGQGRQGV